MTRRRDGRTARGYRDRRVGTRNVVKRFLIVCEGGKTEPLCFEAFPVSTRPDVIEVEVIGSGLNTLGLVRRAVELRAEAPREERYDETWCVFDRDSFPAEDFNVALELASREGIEVAYTNEAFELWYLLHFDYIDAALSRIQYSDKLDKRLGRRYQKNTPTMYEELKRHQPRAIANAEKLLNQYPQPSPEKDNPSTTVHLLVRELNNFLPGQHGE